MKQFIVYQIVEGQLVKCATLTADTARNALRIAKQKGYAAPLIGDVK